MKKKRSRECILLSENMSLDENSHNRHVLLVGGTEEKRISSYIVPNILSTNRPIVVTDRDGVLYRRYGQTLKDREGYDVKLLDPAGIIGKEYAATDTPSEYAEDLRSLSESCSVSYNPFASLPFDGVHNEDVEMLADIIVGDIFADEDMREAGRALLTALIAYLHDYTTEPNQTFDGVIRLLRAEIDSDVGKKDVKSVLDLIFEELAGFVPDPMPRSFALENYNTYKEKTEPDSRKDLVLSCLMGLQTPAGNNTEMAGTDSIDLEAICDSRTALFIVLPSEDRSRDIIATMLYAQLFRIFDRYCRACCMEDDGPCPVRIRFLPDEFTNVAKIPGIGEMLGRLAEDGASVTLTIPSSRARRYAKHPRWKEITEGFDTAIYLSDAGILKKAGWFARCLLGRNPEKVPEELTLLPSHRCVITRRPSHTHAQVYSDSVLRG